MSGRIERAVLKKLCLAYWALVSLMLLARNPLAWFGGRREIGQAYDLVEPVVHFLCFAVLALLTCGARWPIRPAVLAALLLSYALGTELLQMLVPGRTAELGDLWQNLAGLIVGFGLWRLLDAAGSAPASESGDPEPSDGDDFQRPRRRASLPAAPGDLPPR